MKKSGKKKVIRQEFIGKSEDYKDGYIMAEDYYEHILNGGNRIGGAPFRVFVEVVAEWIRDKKAMSDERVKFIDYILKWHDCDFNRGVCDLLVRKSNEYRGLKLTEVWVQE